MKYRLLDLLRCPLCEGELILHTLNVDDEEIAAENLISCRTRCAYRNKDVSGGEGPCRECYGKEVVEGVLSCKCGGVFPVDGGVPRMLTNAVDVYRAFFIRNGEALKEKMGDSFPVLADKRYSSKYDKRSQASFELQWKIYQYQDRTWFKELELRVGEFLFNMALSEEEVRSTLMLDVGCGNGRLTNAISRYGMEIVGMDFSRSVERAHLYKKEFAGERAPFVHFLQGDIFQPPFTCETFDHIHSSGVLHHTPSADEAFIHFASLVRKGGNAFIQLYRKRGPLVMFHHNIMRFVTTKIPPRILFPLCILGAPINSLSTRLLALLRGRKQPSTMSNRERAVVIFDNYSPRYQFRFEPHEVEALFIREGFADIQDKTLENEKRQSVAFVGTKPSE